MKHATKLLTIAGATLIGANVASAGFTTINPSLNPAEPTHADILGTLYGGTFSADGVNFTNGTITVTRVDDGLDKLWTGDSPTVVSTNTSLTPTVTFESGKFVLTRASGPGTISFTSDPSDNADGQDHQVSYLVSSGGYILFFEDANGLRPNADFDFNDVVVATTGSPVLVPLPAALSSGLVGLGALGLGRLIRKGRRVV
jgi:hypothetical protein